MVMGLRASATAMEVQQLDTAGVVRGQGQRHEGVVGDLRHQYPVVAQFLQLHSPVDQHLGRMKFLVEAEAAINLHRCLPYVSLGYTSHR
jgi:hypothetical protein